MKSIFQQQQISIEYKVMSSVEYQTANDDSSSVCPDSSSAHPTTTPPKKINLRAVLSGFFAGCGSCAAKLALAPDSYVPNAAYEACLRHHFTTAIATTTSINHDRMCQTIGLLPRGVFLIIMVIVNVLMLATFLDGMNESGSVIATALSTGVNFSTSAAYGMLLFDEEVNLLWFLGFSMILMGVSLLLSVNIQDSNKT